MADKRSDRTKAYLREALLATLLEKPFERVTLKEIVERAEVSKNTFYNYYTDLAELAQDCYFNELVFFRPPYKRLPDYPSKYDAAKDTLDQQLEILEFLQANPNLARVVYYNVDLSPYFAKVAEPHRDLISVQVKFEYGKEPRYVLPMQACVEFAVQGNIGFIRRWVASGMHGSTVALARDSVYLTLQTTAAVMGRAIEPEYRRAIDDWSTEKGL